MKRSFEIRRDTILETTPQAAWDAVNTSEGIASWLFPAGGVGGPEGKGAVWGGHTVLAWDPPRHSLVRMDGEDGFFNALENTFEDRGDGSVLLRYVHSGVMVGDWETQYDGADKHTAFYQHSLAQYVKHFPGRHATYVAAHGPAASTARGAFAGFRQRALGLAEGAAAGDVIRLDVPGIGTITGVVDYLAPQFVGIRTADALYRFYGRDTWGAPTSAGHHLFAPGVDPEAAQAAWAAWLELMLG